MAANKPAIGVFFLINRYNLRTKQRTATYNMSFRTNFFKGFYLFTIKTLKGQTEVIFKVKVKLSLKM